MWYGHRFHLSVFKEQGKPKEKNYKYNKVNVILLPVNSLESLF